MLTTTIDANLEGTPEDVAGHHRVLHVDAAIHTELIALDRHEFWQVLITFEAENTLLRTDSTSEQLNLLLKHALIQAHGLPIMSDALQPETRARLIEW